MKALYIGAVCATLVGGAWACKGDPTADLRGGATSLGLTPGKILIDTGNSTPLVVVVRDSQLNPVASGVTIATADPSIATVRVDTTRPSIDGATHAFVVSAFSPGHTRLTVTGAGLTDSVPTSVLPLVFTGAISTLTPRGGDTITIQSTAVLKFDPEKVQVVFPGDQVGSIVSASADGLTLLVPFSDIGAVTIGGVVVTYVTGLEVSLPSEGVMHQTGDFWIADTSWQTAPDITGLLPASGDTAKMIIGLPADNNVDVCPEFVLGYGSSGPCMIFKLALTSPTTLNFATIWASGDGDGGNPDIDIYACSDSTVANFGTACFEDGGNGATGKNPQVTGDFAYPAGTHYFVVEYYAACDNAPNCTTDGKTRNYYITVSSP
jgi:hypothetical protein